MAEHTALYMINKNVYSKTSKTITVSSYRMLCISHLHTQKECDKELEMGWKAGAREEGTVCTGEFLMQF